MTCLCTDDRAHACSGGGLPRLASGACSCPHHEERVLLDLRAAVARALRAPEHMVTVTAVPDVGAVQVDVEIDGITFGARRATTVDAAQRIVLAAFRALDFGARDHRGRGAGAPIVDVLTHPELAGLGLAAKLVRPHALGVGEYAEAAREDERAGGCGVAYRMEIEDGPDLTGDLE